jgi:CO/xanthine dehydrogenase FAD-binding subunit
MPVQVETHAKLEDAARACAANRNARMFGGGTLLMRAVYEGDQSFNAIVRCTDPRLREIRSESDRIAIGAGVTMSMILANRELAFLAPVARVIGGPAIRSAATVGGNLFAAAPYGEFATVLLALGATIRFAGEGGQPEPIEDFLKNRATRAGRVVEAVLVPRLADSNALQFVKVTRVKPRGIALMSIAAHRSRSGPRGGEFRVAYGNMAPTPIRATAVEQALAGATLDERGIARALAVATEGLDPPTDALGSTWYRREVAPIHLKRLLLGGMR